MRRDVVALACFGQGRQPGCSLPDPVACCIGIARLHWVRAPRQGAVVSATVVPGGNSDQSRNDTESKKCALWMRVGDWEEESDLF